MNSKLLVDGKQVYPDTDDVHVVTSGFSNSFTGRISWTVTNKICNCFFEVYAPNTSDNMRVFYTGMPVAKIGAHTTTYGSVAYVQISAGSSNIQVQKNPGGTYIYGSLTYVVV